MRNAILLAVSVLAGVWAAACSSTSGGGTTTGGGSHTTTSSETTPYYLPIANEIETFTTCFTHQLPILLKGPTGVGKSRFVQHMAARLQRPLITVACHEDLQDVVEIVVPLRIVAARPTSHTGAG